MSISIPVLYYHRAGAPDPISLSVPEELFRRQMEYLQRRGIRSITLRELRKHLDGTQPIRQPSVVITFDDGFRDNFQFAYPILRELGHKAVIFLCSRLLRSPTEPGCEVPRGFTEAHTAAWSGDRGDFLSAAEIEEMYQAGIVEFHSHSLSHQQVFVSRRLTGVYPDTDQHWGIPSAYGQSLVGKGWPVWERKPGLLQPGLFPRIEELRAALKRMPLDQSSDVRQREAEFAPLLAAESSEQWRARVNRELTDSRIAVGHWHDSESAAIAWPWGKTSEETTRMAKEAGYRLAFLTCSGANVPGTDLLGIHRFPVKKPDMVRFALGLWLRFNPTLAKWYGLLHR